MCNIPRAAADSRNLFFLYGLLLLPYSPASVLLSVIGAVLSGVTLG